MKISLMEAVNLNSDLNKKIKDLNRELFTVNTIDVPKGESYEPYARTVEDILDELDNTTNHSIELQSLINNANNLNHVDWDNRKLPIIMAIEVAKSIRKKADIYRNLGNTKKREYTHSYSSNTIMERISLFEPEQYRKDAEKLNRQAQVLSARIDKTNLNAEIDVPFASEYLDIV